MRVLVTRQAGSWPELEARFAPTPIVLQWDPTTVQLPPLDAAPGDAAVAHLDRYDWLLVTSPRGVDALTRLLAARQVTELPPRIRVAAIGPATVHALESAGLAVAVVAEDANSVGLAAALRPHVKTGGRLLLVGPAGSTGALAGALRAPGVEVDEAPLYRTVASERARALAEDAIAGRFAAVAFTAPSTLTLWLEAAGPRRDALAVALAAVKRVAIGKTTEARLASVGLPASAVAEAPTQAAVGDAIARALSALDLLT